MSSNKIEINLPDFIDYEDMKESIKYDIKSNIKYWVRDDVMKTQNFQQMIRETIKEQMAELLKTTNLGELLERNVRKSMEKYFEDFDTFKYNSNITTVINKMLISETDFIKEKTLKAVENFTSSDENTFLENINWKVRDIIIEKTVEELAQSNYMEFIKDSIFYNFEQYFPRKDDNHE
jgi:hypothetical protein